MENSAQTNSNPQDQTDPNNETSKPMDQSIPFMDPSSLVDPNSTTEVKPEPAIGTQDISENPKMREEENLGLTEMVEEDPMPSKSPFLEQSGASPIGFASASMTEGKGFPTDNVDNPVSAQVPEPDKSKPKKSKGKGGKVVLTLLVILIIASILGAVGYFAYSFFSSGNLDLGSIFNINFGGKKEEVTLTYWGIWEPKENIQPIIDAYQKENPNVNIIYEERSPEFYFETLQSRLGKETGPDIVRIHNTWIHPLQKRLAAVPSTVLDNETYESTFYRVAQETLKSGSSYYAIPLEYDGISLIYNQTLFEEAGISKAPETWDDFREYAKKLTKYAEKEVDGKMVTEMIQAGAAIGSKDIDNFSDILGLLMAQNGVDFVDEKGNVTLDKTISIDGRNLGAEALSFYALFAKGDEVVWNDEWLSAHDAFAAGNVAMMFGPTWRVMNLLEANRNLKVKVAPVPQIPLGEDEKTNVNWASFWAEAVSKTAKNEAVAWDFLKFMTEKEQMVDMFTIASDERIFGEPYSRQDLYSTLSVDPYLGSYVKAANSATSWYMCDRTYDKVFNDKVNEALGEALQKVIDGGTSETAIKEAATKITKILTDVKE